jgi:outer membrane protein insertion porin family
MREPYIFGHMKKLLFVFIAFIGVLNLQAQSIDTLPVIDYSIQKSYEIGKIDVTGAEYAEPIALVGVSGLKVGNVIDIPGNHIPDAIKSLYKLSLFTDVEISATKIIGDVIFLNINVKERPRYLTHSFKGVKRTYHEDLTKVIERHLRRGSILTENIENNIIQGVKEYFHEKGFLDAEVKLSVEEIAKKTNSVRVLVQVDEKEKVKIGQISFTGNAMTDDKALNKKLSDKKLRKQFDETKLKGRLFGKSKYVDELFQIDKDNVIAYYNRLGFRDARILDDTIYRNADGDLAIVLEVAEGKQYYFRNISWEGNTIYDDATLGKVLGIKVGDVYDTENLDQRLQFSQDSRDVSSLYMDNGYLFFQVDPVEVTIDKDSIDLEMRIYEGPQATIDKVTIEGNDRTHEHVVRRILRTNPGEKFSRSQIIRSQREILNLGYFDPESLGINTPVNAARGTVDIEYTVTERPSDQLELSAGYNGAAGLLGTVGVTFNNFSARRMFEKGAWRPVPMGDGQKLSIRAQSNGDYYKSLNFSFTEPWLGGKKPNSLTVGGFLNSILLAPYVDNKQASYGELLSATGYVGIGSRLNWPDDYFFTNTTLYFQHYNLKRNIFSNSSLFQFEGKPMYRGAFNNFYIKQQIARSSINEPLFPTRGSKFSLTVQLTPPYSLFKDDNFWVLSDEQRADVIAEENELLGFYNQLPLTETNEETAVFNAESSQRFKYLEYHKWRFDAEWYTQLIGKLVLRSSVKMGYIGYYNKRIGIPPFERFELGGDGLNNQSTTFQGVDIIRLRGYEVEDVADRNNDGFADNADEAIIFNKYELEFRYPISGNPNSTIFLLGFLEGGNSWNSFSSYQPFDLKRSAGLGLRVFLPVFGLLGFDYGWGFDKPLLREQGAKWTEYGKFGLIIGFEPD